MSPRAPASEGLLAHRVRSGIVEERRHHERAVPRACVAHKILTGGDDGTAGLRLSANGPPRDPEREATALRSFGRLVAETPAWRNRKVAAPEVLAAITRRDGSPMGGAHVDER